MYCQLRTIKPNLKDHAYVVAMQFDSLHHNDPFVHIQALISSPLLFVASSSTPTILITYSAETMLCRVGEYQHWAY